MAETQGLRNVTQTGAAGEGFRLEVLRDVLRARERLRIEQEREKGRRQTTLTSHQGYLP